MAMTFKNRARLNSERWCFDVSKDLRRAAHLDPLGCFDVTPHQTVDDRYWHKQIGTHFTSFRHDQRSRAGTHQAGDIAINPQGGFKSEFTRDRRGPENVF